jgi:Kef-type K+ transport system membrane component KefB
VQLASYLPAWPLELNGFVLFGALILVGVAGGHLAYRTGFLPRITGFIAAGFLLGPSVLGLLTVEMLDMAKLFVELALGLILFQLGRLLNLPLAMEAPGLLWVSLLESALSFVLVYGVLVALGIDPLPAALAAAIGISSSPAVVFMVVKELDASGPLTDRTLMLVAFNNILSFLAYTLLLPFLHYSQAADWDTVFLQPLYKLGMSLLLAWGLAQLLLWLARLVGRSEGLQFALLIGVIVGGVGLAKVLEASILLTLLAMGGFAHYLDRRQALLEVDFGHGGQVFFVILFVVAGANLHVHDLVTAGWAAVGFVVARFIGKGLGALMLMRTGLPREKAVLGGLTLMPMAGMAIGLTQSTAALYPAFATTLTAIVLGAIAILETIGPIATEYALKRSGEVNPDARLDH